MCIEILYIYKYCLHAKGFYQFFGLFAYTYICHQKKGHQMQASKPLLEVAWARPAASDSWPGTFFLPSLSCIFFGTLKGSLHKAEWIAWWACRLASWKAQWNHDLGQTHVQTKKKDGKQKKMCQILAKQAPSPGPKVQRLNFVNFCFF